MTWMPLLATLLGAVIALSSAVLVERRRERREDRVERRKTKREVYGRYLAAHADTRTQLRVLSLAVGLNDEDRRNRAFSAYAACYAARYELAVLAPQSVLTPANDFDRCARDLRDLVMDGRNMHATAGEPARMQNYLDAMKLVHLAMRIDLGADGRS